MKRKEGAEVTRAHRILKGVGVSPGVAIGSAQVLTRHAIVPAKRIVAEPEMEALRLRAAIDQTVQRLERVAERAASSIGADEAAIFSAHAMMLADPVLYDNAATIVRTERICAERAFADEVEKFAVMLASADDPYLRSRAVDLRDICRQVVDRLQGEDQVVEDRQAVALIADELYPSDTVAIDRRRLRAIVSRLGSEMSHTAILARSLGIPAVVGTQDVEAIRPGVTIIVDGTKGWVIIDPTDDELQRAQQEMAENEEREQAWSAYKDRKVYADDGRTIDILANIGEENDVPMALAAGAEGVGLFRTEFLYMRGPGLPSEDEQALVYENVLRLMGDRPVTLRTLDIGGDKHVPGLTLPHETNPFLGCRAIRLCLEHPDLFRVQLRAIYRASVWGNPQLLLPMLTDMDELNASLEIIESVQSDLRAHGVSYRKIPIGVMIEVPAAALIAQEFAARVDFLSIGTNDLIQYTLAADRLNDRVSYLRRKPHPGILRLITMVIEGAHLHRKHVSVCGEMAANPRTAAELVRLGVDKLSMAAPMIGAVKSALIGA